ncbi:hypothetical protein MmiEs2_14880 [Methanimicrococcus stummii]|uniref:TIGR00725 family protein n=1 Tax=Methanimicrococcus stummii TaxID=3028294 RepID=A0AA96VAJ1_9EURY|nr:TIGR00725 family protein [Methanimicrococcus sp. Es2]WNY29263.1 hypothetical protein MmiEs2_14880 [Methanimicrococcus sp. Es2]
MKKYTIAVVGDAFVDPNSEKYELAEKLGKALIDNGYRIVCGGLGGVMEAVSKGAFQSEYKEKGDVIGILPGFDKSSNEYIDISFSTGLDVIRNTIVANSDAVIAIGGGAGTLSEMAFAWTFHRLVIAYRIDGWSGKLADSKIDGRIRYPDIPDDRVYAVDNEIDSINFLSKLLPKYCRVYDGIKQSTRNNQ